ncbi:MAG: hypothetical protein ABR599_08030 [Gemmatimonadota bacterium]
MDRQVSAGTQAASAEASPPGRASRWIAAPAGAALRPDVVLVYGSSSHGYLEPCGCGVKGEEMGGLARRATLVDSLRGQSAPVLLVEVGDFVGGGGEPGHEIAEVSLEAMQAMSYDVMALGDAELALGERFLDHAARSGIPVAHANWSHPALGAQAEGLMIEKSGRKIGVVGILDPEALPQDLPLENLTIGDPAAAAAAAARSLREAGAELILVLGHADFRRSGRLAPAAGEPDLWIVGHGGKELSEPLPIDGVLLLGSGNMGKRAGVLELDFDTAPGPRYANLLYPLHETMPEQAAVAAIVKDRGAHASDGA